MTAPPVTVLALVEDLMFASRIAEAAKARGGASMKVRTAAALRDAPATAKLVVVDLDRPLAPLEEIVSAAGALPVVGFFSHVEPDKGREARKLGFAKVLPRSAFVKELPYLV